LPFTRQRGMAADVIHPLARAVLEALASDARALAELRDLVAAQEVSRAELQPPAHTAGGLAEALGVSSKVVRNAIARGELPAVKRGGRWYVAAGAVAAWAHDSSATSAHRAPVTRRARADTMHNALARLESP
jgi:excisionase family DNA binding protein